MSTAGKRLFRSLFVRVLGVLSLPEGRLVKKCPGCEGSCIMFEARLRRRPEWMSLRLGRGEPLDCPDHPLQIFLLLCSAAGVPWSTAVCQNAFDRAAVEVGQEFLRELIPFQGPQKEQPLLGFFDDLGCVQAPGQVLSYVHPQELKTSNSLHLLPINLQFIALFFCSFWNQLSFLLFSSCWGWGRCSCST